MLRLCAVILIGLSLFLVGYVGVNTGTQMGLSGGVDAGAGADALLLETGDYFLLESGDKLLLE